MGVSDMLTRRQQNTTLDAMANDSQRFAHALREVRRSLGLSLREMADLIAWHATTINKYERGERQGVPSREELERVEFVLDLRHSTLVGAAGYQVRDRNYRTLSYLGDELTVDEEKKVLEYIEFLKMQRSNGQDPKGEL